MKYLSSTILNLEVLHCGPRNLPYELFSSFLVEINYSFGLFIFESIPKMISDLFFCAVYLVAVQNAQCKILQIVFPTHSHQDTLRVSKVCSCQLLLYSFLIILLEYYICRFTIFVSFAALIQTN